MVVCSPMPHLINRRFMPQIDEKDLIPLLAYLAQVDVQCFFTTREAHTLTSHQAVDENKVKGIMTNPEALSKPLLIAERGCVLDGNHRGAAHKALGTPRVNVIVIPLPYEDALLALAHAPETYEYGDGKFHPITQ